MSLILKLAMFLFAFGFFMQANPVSYVRHGYLTSKAEALIGRPATPVSYAGVARRTARRW